MHPKLHLEHMTVRALGLTLVAIGGVCADFAAQHARALGAICGAGHDPHCGWCYGAAGFLLLGVAALVSAARGPTAARRPAK